MRRPLLSGLVVPALLALAFTPTHATTVARMTTGELLDQARDVVHAVALSSESRWNEKHTLIVTETRFQVLDRAKGNASEVVSIVQPGGTVGKLRMEVPGAAAYRVGEEAVLFLVPQSPNTHVVFGLSLGRFDVVTDPGTGHKRVRGVPALGLAAHLDRDRTPMGTESHAAPVVQIGPDATVESFLDLLRQRAGGGR